MHCQTSVLVMRRTLIDLDQMKPALAQLNQLTQQHPTFAPGWLFLGLLQSDLTQVLLSEQSLKQYIKLVDNAKDPDSIWRAVRSLFSFVANGPEARSAHPS
jgi:hypothetical protein